LAKLLLGDKHKTHSPRLLRLLWTLEAGVVGLLGAISRLLPPDTASRIAARLARHIGPRLDKTRLIRRNLKVAFPEKSAAEIDQLVHGVWGTLGSIVAEYPHLPTICGTQAEQRLEIVMQDKFPVFDLTGKKPAVFVTAHLGNWEIAAATIAHLGVPLTVVYTALQNPRMDHLLRNAREALGYRMIERSSAARELVRRLKAGTSVGLIVDQRVDSGAMIPLFGHDMLTSITPAQLALRFGCDLIPVQIQRMEGARFRVIFHLPVTADDAATPDEQKVLQMTRKVNALFEDWIRERPHEWMCTKRRWPKHLTKPDWHGRVDEP
jgi:KDO2-lipid IV(A) lauroyltransferase